MRYLFAAVFVFSFNFLFAQTVTLSGYVRNQNAEPLEQVTVSIVNTRISTQTDEAGFYTLKTSATRVIVTFARIGFKSLSLELGLIPGDVNNQNAVLVPDSRSLQEVQINEERANRSNTIGVNAGLVAVLPSVSGNFESILKTLPGVSANNELSSQYAVRGGNFDENLVYVNDIEIYRPLLIRNGQQEGLSFINPELAGRVNFSAGGFEARYGDKLSSVLDVKYLRPDSNSIIASLGLLGNSATFKFQNKTSYLLAGIRLKNNGSLLNSQDVKGDYQPQFSDYQAIYSKDLNRKLSYSILANYNSSIFNLEPQSRETRFGTFNEVLRLQVNYNGKESDRYQTLMGAVTMLYKQTPTLNFKWINSAFNTNEQERFDISGSYIFDEIETDFGNPAFGNVRANRGIGSNTNYARNKLQANLYSSEIKVYKQYTRSFLEGGLKFQSDNIRDNINEYEVIDSAGYILPVNSQSLEVYSYVKASNNLSVNRLSGYLQNTFEFSKSLTVSGGLRANYNSFTSQLLLSPRITVAYQPHSKPDFLWRLSAGSYNQPPFYREFRRFNGTLNREAEAQRSWHFLSGADYRFDALGTQLKLSSELYYKWLSNLTPYKIENLRIRYFADQRSSGYAAGADFSLSGQFVSDLESSFRISLLKTAEDIENDFYFRSDPSGNPIKIEPGYLKRPSDQRVNFSIFFQDQLLNSPSNKVHLTLLYGSALPIGPPGAERHRDVFKIPAYKRVDIGFSKDFTEKRQTPRSNLVNRYFESLTAYAEVFNLLDINNTVSYLWIKDVNNNQYAVPNYLTSRRFNFRIIARIKNN